MPRDSWQYLFSEYDLRQTLENRLAQVGDRVLRVTKEELAAASDEQIAARIAADLLVEPLEIDESEIEVSSRDCKVDVSHDPMRAVMDRSRPAYVDGVEVTYHLPYRGDAGLLRSRGSTFTMNPPRAVLGTNALLFPYQIPNRDVAATKGSFQRDLATLREWMPWTNEPVAAYNASLEERVRSRVISRRAELEQTKTDLAGLGFKVKADVRVDNTARPVEAPTSRRRRAREVAAKEYDVALSFAGEERPYVSQVAEKLRELSVSVFYDDFETVDLWGKELTAHLGSVYSKQSRFVVIFASKHYAAKAWPNHERASALSKQFEGDRDRVLPVRFDSTDIPGIPSTIGYLDSRVLSPDKLAELIRQKVDSIDA